MKTLQNILEIENTPEILKFSFGDTNNLLWPRIRIPLMRMLIERVLYEREMITDASSKNKTSYIQISQCLLKSYFKNLWILGNKAEIVIFSYGLKNIRLGNKYINRVSDYFAGTYPNETLLIEEPYEWQHQWNRNGVRVASHIPLRATVVLTSRSPFRRIDTRLVTSFLDFLNERIESSIEVRLSDKQYRFLENELIRHCAGLKQELQLYEKLYNSLAPKLIMFETGLYGRYGHLIKLAKEMGIKTAEMQHGLVSSGHDAYNFAPTILSSERYKQYTPDFFLTYGRWWAEQISVPAEIILIGNPHYEMMCSKYAINKVKGSKILILSDAERFEYFLEFAQSLSARLSEQFEVLLRPHPMIRSEVIKRYGMSFASVTIDNSNDIYERLNESYAVIGESSTVLFEAIGLVQHIFTISNRTSSFYLPNNPFQQFDSINDLVDKLLYSNIAMANQKLQESVWQPNWKENYQKFIKERVYQKFSSEISETNA